MLKQDSATLKEILVSDVRYNLECWEHFSLILSVDRIVVILHGDERCKLVVDRVVLHDVDY